MFKYITVAALLASTSAVSLRNRKADQKERKLIVNGQNADDDYPWFVQFDDNSCGGTLFDEQHVLTSATCVTPNAPALVYIGATSRDNPDDGVAYEHEVECAIRHPEYDPQNRKNDIAVIKLKRRCPVETVRLANENDQLNDDAVANGLTFWELGLGDTSPDNQGTYLSVLQEAEMNYVSDSDCQLVYGDEDLQQGHHVCVNFDTTKGYCSGDGGTPLMDESRENGKQYGVATPPTNATCIFENNGATGQYKCGDPAYPDVYADVATFRNWIDSTVSAGTDQCDSLPPCFNFGTFGFASSAMNYVASFLP